MTVLASAQGGGRRGRNGARTVSSADAESQNKPVDGSAGGGKEHNWPLVLAGRCQEWLLVSRPSPLPEPYFVVAALGLVTQSFIAHLWTEAPSLDLMDSQHQIQEPRLSLLQHLTSMHVSG